MKAIVIIAVCSCIAYSGVAQKEGEKSKEGFFDRFEVKKSFENDIDKEKPAVASFTIPGNENNYFTINGGIAFRTTALSNSSKINFDVWGLYNRNNQIDKEQNNYKLGTTIELYKLFYNKDNIAPANFSLKVNWSNEYQSNKIDTVSSYLSLLYFSPFFAISDNIKIGVPISQYKNKRFLPMFKLIPGLEYQNKFNAPTSGEKGNILRAYFSASSNFIIRTNRMVDEKAKLTNLIETGVSYIYRKDFLNKTANEEGYLPLFNFSFAVFPFANDNISFGATYLHGSDPVAALEKQEFWQFEFKFKKDLKSK